MLLEDYSTAITRREEAREPQRRRGLFAAREHARADVRDEIRDRRDRDGREFGILADGGVPDETGVGGTELQVVGDVVDGRLEDGRVRAQRLPVADFLQGVARELAHGGGIGIGLRHAHFRPQQVGERGDFLWIGAGYGEDDAHLGERDDFANEFFVARELYVGVLGGEVEIAARAHGEIGQQRLRAAVLELHLHPLALLELARDGLDGRLEARRAEDEQRLPHGRAGDRRRVRGLAREHDHEHDGRRDGREE